MKRFLGLVLLLGACDRRDPPPDDKRFNKLMEETREHSKPVVKVYACNRAEFSAHLSDKKSHLGQASQDQVFLQLETYAIGRIDPKGTAEQQEKVFADFTKLAEHIVRFPRTGNEEQLYRIVEIDADPEVPDQVIDRIERIVKKIGVIRVRR